MYIPNPIRCRLCLRLGHYADSCPSKEPLCSFCAKPQHSGSSCETIVPHCVNCRQNHPSIDPKCPKFIEEKEIKAIQFKEKIPYNAAKKYYRETHNTLSKSYAEVAKPKKMISIGCQTEENTYIYESIVKAPYQPALLEDNCKTGLTPLLKEGTAPLPPPSSTAGRAPAASPPLTTPPLPSTSPPSPPAAVEPAASPIPTPLLAPALSFLGDADPPSQVHSSSPINNNISQGTNTASASETIFKTPPQPQRSTQRNSKGQKKKHTKNEDDMET